MNNGVEYYVRIEISEKDFISNDHVEAFGAIVSQYVATFDINVFTVRDDVFGTTDFGGFHGPNRSESVIRCVRLEKEYGVLQIRWDE